MLLFVIQIPTPRYQIVVVVVSDGGGGMDVFRGYGVHASFTSFIFTHKKRFLWHSLSKSILFCHETVLN